MSQFNEANSVRDFVRDLIDSIDVQFVPGSELPRAPSGVLLEVQVKDALIRLNPEIRADPRLADEVLYQLRAIVQVGAEHAEPRRSQRGIHGLADRAEVDAVRAGR